MRYDESAIVDRLRAVDRGAKTLFAATCAQLLMPLFARYADVIGRPELVSRLETAILIAWDAETFADVDMAAAAADAVSMIPTDEDEWVFESGYGQNAAAAVAYAIEAWQSDDPQKAAWAARQVYEVADYVTLQRCPELNLNAPGSEVLVSNSKLIQNALTWIERTLKEVEASGKRDDLRTSAELDSLAFAAILL